MSLPRTKTREHQRNVSVDITAGYDVKKTTTSNENNTANNSSVNNTININATSPNMVASLPSINIEPIGEQPASEDDDNLHPSNFKSNVVVPTKTVKSIVPPATQRHVITNIIPTISRADIENNINFHKILVNVLLRTIDEDIGLVALNILDRSDCKIVKANSLQELIAAMLSSDDIVVNVEDIKIVYSDVYVDGCGCLKKAIKVPLVLQVESIKFANQDLMTSQNEALNVLSDVYNISLKLVHP